MRNSLIRSALAAGVLAMLTAACVPIEKPGAPGTSMATAPDKPAKKKERRRSGKRYKVSAEKFEADRKAILAMAGDYKVTFDFRETVSLADGYELKDPKLSGGNEFVRVIEDRGDFISLQHILLVGPGSEIVVKHWRQDWQYEPKEIWEFVGHNGWRVRKLSQRERRAKWAQLVYQVDDSPRYAAVAKWKHQNGASDWTSPKTWRPLPRRDATTRDDYDAIVAVNRHALTPFGWVHEQDNSKLVLDEDPHFLVREVGVNTYKLDDSYETAPGEKYWDATKEFWAAIRGEWARIADENEYFALTVNGETEAVYMPILQIAEDVAEGTMSAQEGAEEAIESLRSFITTDIKDNPRLTK